MLISYGDVLNQLMTLSEQGGRLKQQQDNSKSELLKIRERLLNGKNTIRNFTNISWGLARFIDGIDCYDANTLASCLNRVNDEEEKANNIHKKFEVLLVYLSSSCFKGLFAQFNAYQQEISMETDSGRLQICGKWMEAVLSEKCSLSQVEDVLNKTSSLVDKSCFSGLKESLGFHRDKLCAEKDLDRMQSSIRWVENLWGKRNQLIYIEKSLHYFRGIVKDSLLFKRDSWIDTLKKKTEQVKFPSDVDVIYKHVKQKRSLLDAIKLAEEKLEKMREHFLLKKYDPTAYANDLLEIVQYFEELDDLNSLQDSHATKIGNQLVCKLDEIKSIENKRFRFIPGLDKFNSLLGVIFFELPINLLVALLNAFVFVLVYPFFYVSREEAKKELLFKKIKSW